VSDEDEIAISALRRLRAAVRGGVSPKRRPPAQESRSGDRDPALLGEAVRDFMTAHKLDVRQNVARVLEDWARLVGEDVAAHVTVESFIDGDLLLRADSTAWANQMRLLQATLQRRLDEELGAEVVTSIRVLGPDAPSWKFGQRRVPGRGPRDTYG
jgi:predicted nucleic acid-binding Zn ribbon protein